MTRLRVTRRDALILGGIAAAGAASLTPSAAVPGQMEAAIRKAIGDAKVQKGKVTLDLPPLVENGNSVPMTVTVASPMTAQERVKAIHVFNEKNPLPNVISAYLGPRAGQAKLSTRMRLADSQRILAVAEMSDGTFWSDDVEVIVTIAACLEEP